NLALYEIVKKHGSIFLSTPMTEDWVEFLNPLCAAIKIASGDITFRPVIAAAAQTGKPIILSTGAATIDEIDHAVQWVAAEIMPAKLTDRLILMHCVSAYPTPIAEANMLSIPFLRKRYHVHVGYSNHVIGMNACLAAVSLGATLIEVHFTDQKEGRFFRDHSLSFDANDLRRFIQSAKEIHSSLGKYGKSVQACERANIPLMRKGIIAAAPIQAGELLTVKNLMYARPADEFSAMEISALLGKCLNRNIPKGHPIPKDAVICVA
ncbi:MAG: spore coat polysaccharide biosynthesis protein E, partial [uncultured bacterium]